MLEFEAFQEFKKIAEGPVSENDFDSALRSTITHLQNISNGGQFVRPYVHLIPTALESLTGWYTTSFEYHVNHADPGELARFVVTHITGCAWAVLLRRSHGRKEPP